MNHLKPSNPNVYCLIKGVPMCISKEQCKAIADDHNQIEYVSKERYLEVREIRLNHLKQDIRIKKMLEPMFAEIFTPINYQ